MPVVVVAKSAERYHPVPVPSNDLHPYPTDAKANRFPHAGRSESEVL